ncbi:MAG: hypothetical protein H0W78_06095 [Planctomycetes bacterium]|jgi:hypothetical protein|nr:hypothetical protein [Planctomycetota bacterium]
MATCGDPGCGLRSGERTDHPAVMRVLLWFSLAVLIGCKAHQPPDDAVAVRLRSVVVDTCTAMRMDQQPSGRVLDDQVGLLTMRLSADQVQKITGGTIDRAVVVQGYRAALARRAERQSRSAPPRLLVFLVDHQPQWSNDQTLLAAALLAQYEHEAKLAAPPPTLNN